MVDEMVARLLVDCAVLLAGAALAQLLRWLAARLGIGGIPAEALPAELALLALRKA
jgi:hypothetical protein